MDKSQQIFRIARDRLGNQPTYNPVEFLEMCAVVRDEIEAAEQTGAVDLLHTCACGDLIPADEYRCLNCQREAANH